MQEINKVNRYYEASNGDFTVSLFPYQIKDVNNFYDRNHPKEISPNSFEYNLYWTERIKNYIEGRWIDDNGTWVYMFPKLDFYINYTTIADEDRNNISPRLRDLEWIQITYYSIGDGWSGFEDDDIYTSNRLVEKIEKNKTLNRKESELLEKYDKYLRNKEGKYKKFIDPWEYLTEHYLLSHNQGKPLGRSLWQNQKQNIMILAARACAKSYIAFLADFLHEWTFDGVRTAEEFCNNRPKNLLFAMGAKASDTLQKSINNVARFYPNMPGSYSFGVTAEGKPDKVLGTLYKRIVGKWNASSSGVEHSVVNKDNTDDVKGNKAFFHALGPDAINICAGDRYRRVYIDEAFMLPYIKDVHAVNTDSLKVGSNKDGMSVYLGTGGDLVAVLGAKEMFDSPAAFDIVSIPNYFDKSVEGRTALFIPVTYQDENLKDKNGNTLMEESLAAAINKRISDKASLDSSSFAKSIAFNPLYQKEVLRPSNYSVLPQVEISEHLANLISPRGLGMDGQPTNIFKQNTTIGSFHYSPQYVDTGGVRFKPDLEKNLSPILEWGKDSMIENKEGAWVMLEDVIESRPSMLYYVLVDPLAQDGEGTSLMSIQVYKHFFVGGAQSGSLQDTIVCSYTGRKERLTDGYEEAIKVAMYYNAKIVLEMNILGMYTYMEQRGLLHMMQPEPIRVINDKIRTGKRSSGSYHKVGIRTDKAINDWSLQQLAQWLMTPVIVDDKTNKPLKYKYETIFDLRLLSELANYNHEKKTKFDATSALMLLFPVLADIEDDPVMIDEEEDKWDIKYQSTYIDNRPRVTTPIIMQF